MAGVGSDDVNHLPLRAVVLCCTSVPPETRSQIAAMAEEMGAEHKLDLTSDVTHMIVGELQTPKYKYVAKEREDVRCLLAEWIYACREQFLSGGDIQIEDLEKKYKAPTFWGLTVCITGFEDHEQRKEMEIQITNHGGQYRGDLRKDCTHLICFSPVGAKYASAKAWGIHTVSIEWLSMSIQRGMVLDEEHFSPTLLPEERGVGAWKRTVPTRLEPLKRSGSDGLIGRTRKLRRTASARFSSDNVWGDIVSAGPSPALEPSDSFAMALREDAGPLRQEKTIGVGSRQKASPIPEAWKTLNGTNDSGIGSLTGNARTGGLFLGKRFLIHGFDQRRRKLLEQHLQAQDAQICSGADEFQHGSGSLVPFSDSFTVMPYSSAHDGPVLEPGSSPSSVVTELWLEKCLHQKSFISPLVKPIYSPFRHPLPRFDSLRICSTGFTGVDLMHLSKVVGILGATYAEGLSPTVSMLLCQRELPEGPKTRYAQSWKIPIVNVQWLWDCVVKGECLSYEPYILTRQSIIEPNGVSRTKMMATITRNLASASSEKKQLFGRSLDMSTEVPKPPDLVVKDSFVAKSDAGTEGESAPPNRQILADLWRAPESLPVSEPLRDMSPNISRQSSNSPTKSGVGDGGKSTQRTNEELTNVLTSMLNKARENPRAPSPSRRRRQLLGRARSDLSTRSMGSRAGSVDSVNTDGLGTPLDAAFRTSPSKPKPALKPPINFTKDDPNSLTAELLLSHEELEERERALEEESTPVMTQVGYDDSEANIWRERLSRKMAGDTGKEPASPDLERDVERRRPMLVDEGKQSISTRTRHNLGL